MRPLRLHTEFHPSLSRQSEIPCARFEPNEKVSVKEFIDEYARSGLLPSRRVPEAFGEHRSDDDILDAGQDLGNKQYIDPLEAYVDDVQRSAQRSNSSSERSEPIADENRSVATSLE